MWIGMLGVFAACLAASTWVYAWRGRVRFRSLREYVRRGWPFMALPNCLLYACTRHDARAPILPTARFPGLTALCAQWLVIREEAQALLRAGVFEATRDPRSPAWFDLGFRTFQRQGWSKFYLQWYGVTQPSAERLCPRTVALLRATPGLCGAMFTVLPAGARLERHLDPMACSLRLHLGLKTPDDPRCRIEIDGEVRVWRDGEAFVFDETYLHQARNDTREDRVILMCDIERPLNLLGRAFNAPLLALMSLTVVPNLPGDHRGMVNRAFIWLAPWLGWPRRFKPRHPGAYRLGKVMFNAAIATGLLAGLSGLVVGSSKLLGWLAGLAA